MTHEDIRSRLLAALDRTLDPHEMDEVERHVADCAECRLEQVELHRMRRSMDREERAREEAQPRKAMRFGPLGAGGLVRVLLLGAATVSALLILWRRHAEPPRTRATAPPLASATVRVLGPGALAGRGRLRAVAGGARLALGEALEVPAGSLALVTLPRRGRVVLVGPSAGGLDAEGGWRAVRGRVLLEASGALPMRFADERGALVLAQGTAAAWEAWETPTPGPGMVLALLEGEAFWVGLEGSTRVPLAPGSCLRVSPGELKPQAQELPIPSWVEDLKAVLAEAETDVVIPSVRLAPED